MGRAEWVIAILCCHSLSCASSRAPQAAAPVAPWALNEQAVRAVALCRPQCISPLVARRAVEAVEAGLVEPSQLELEGPLEQVAMRWRLAAVRAPNANAPWPTKLQGRPIEPVQLDGFHQADGEPTCVTTVAQLARAEWDPSYAQGIVEQPELARKEQLELLVAAGGRSAADPLPSGVQPHLGDDFLAASFSKMYGYPYSFVLRGAWARRELPRVLALGFTVPFSIKHQTAGAHELLAIAAADNLVLVTDPIDGQRRWVDVDALFTEPLLALNRPQWSLADLFMPDLGATDAECVASLRRHAQGGVGKALSLPSPLAGRPGCFQQFEWGIVIAQPQREAVQIRAGIYTHYSQMGGTRSWLGLPLTEEHPEDGGVIADFEHGHIHWSVERGAWATK